MNNKPPVLVIAGPTASGKTALGVALAKLYNGEVISADSMQIYKGMDIATAKPTIDEMQGIPILLKEIKIFRLPIMFSWHIKRLMIFTNVANCL